MAHRKELRPKSKYMLREVYLAGLIAKGDVNRLTNKSDNAARATMKELLDPEQIGLVKLSCIYLCIWKHSKSSDL